MHDTPLAARRQKSKAQRKRMERQRKRKITHGMLCSSNVLNAGVAFSKPKSTISSRQCAYSRIVCITKDGYYSRLPRKRIYELVVRGNLVRLSRKYLHFVISCEKYYNFTQFSSVSFLFAAWFWFFRETVMLLLLLQKSLSHCASGGAIWRKTVREFIRFGLLLFVLPHYLNPKFFAFSVSLWSCGYVSQFESR